MGLALQEPTDSTYLSNLTEHRHLPGRREYTRDKYSRRPFHWSRDKFSRIDLRYETDSEHQRQCERDLPYDGIPSDIAELVETEWIQLKRRHHLAALAFQSCHGRRNKFHGTGTLDARLQQRSAPSPNWTDEEEEGRALARSRMSLPSDRGRERRRPPSLERQEAFRAPSTSRKRSHSGMSELLEEEELYRLGLLYDNEHERGSGFSLGTITHDQPLFNIRPAKRGRGRKAKHADDSSVFEADLPLHLSLSALGDDEALAALLISPDDYELEQLSAPSAPSRPGGRRAASQPSLTIIYELETEDELDFLSEPNTQRSLDLSSTPAYSEFPSITSHSGDDDEIDEKEEEEAWALLDSLDRLGDDACDSGREESKDALSPTNADAWILLGDDS